MTTTAEKIEALELLIKAEESKKLPRGWVIALLDDDKKELEESLKMFDPEPLERWVNVYEASNRSDAAHPTKDLAKQRASGNAKRVAVHMREVTPQDEQDRKDAARYRKYKDLLRRKTNGWWCRINFDTLDRLLDEAIEGGDAE